MKKYLNKKNHTACTPAEIQFIRDLQWIKAVPVLGLGFTVRES